MKRLPVILAVALFWVATLGAQSFSDRFKESYRLWEMTLERGDGTAVRRGVEALLQKEGLSVSQTDYNEMHALVAVQQMAARACALEGAWEDAIAYLQKAEATASDNVQRAGDSLGKIRKEHEARLVEWKENIAQQEPRLKALEEQPGLTKEMVQTRTQVRDYIEERRNSIQHSEQSLRDIDGILGWLKKDQETSSKALAAWQEFLAKEKQDLAQVGSVHQYVVDKLEQVEADDARPRFDRLAYARRLHRLDPSNPGGPKFIDALLGGDEAPEAAPAKPTKKKRKK
jgi:chromosome segregation ATPase